MPPPTTRPAPLEFALPPSKRAKTFHPYLQHPRRSAGRPIALCCPAGVRPLTSRLPNGAWVGAGSDPETPVSCQTRLLATSLPAHHRCRPQVAHSPSAAIAFGLPTALPAHAATCAHGYIHPALAALPPPTAHPFLPPYHQMAFHFGPDPLRSAIHTLPADMGGVPAKPPFDSDFPDFLYDFDINGQLDLPLAQSSLTDSSCDADFTSDMMASSAFFEAEDQLASWDFTSGPISANPSSPISRSASRSSCGSASFDTDSSSPYPEDYPTPSSDSTVTTPTPNEPVVGLASALHPASFRHDFAFTLEPKPKDHFTHALSYVPGSAPLSPSGFSFDFGSFTQQLSPPLYPFAAPVAPTFVDARRHSEPATLGSAQLPFLVPAHQEVPAPSPTAVAATRPIADQPRPVSTAARSALAHASAPQPTSFAPSALTLVLPPPPSIAPHQTQLLEIKSPRPVRGFKPPILLSAMHYDPKDFVRRRSEPILPLRELDVVSHLALDAAAEEEEEEAETMEVEEELACKEEEVEEELPMFVDNSDAGLDSWMSLEQDGSLFDSNFSWYKSEELQLPALALPSEQHPFNDVLEWNYGVAAAEMSAVPRLGWGA
ncbi:uncharacterized protein BXZ73DRAFT_104705 [Epithele typhae]|uniref:uncharacterized protein n=1 Tax=Epithele typhae TaxID=378194 RepID=UPI00200777C7|nr:uncharacterized protein BXZ73DRAFT_104705 [Epithele typhae]KAH9920192.1 hypothetical protein BXZ73DRAFT_104705 [Epithele typhae]